MKSQSDRALARVMRQDRVTSLGRKGADTMKRTMEKWEYGYRKEGNVIYPKYHPTHEIITCSVYGEFADGRKVWVEIDAQGNPVNPDAQYILGWDVINGKQIGAFYRV